MFESPPLNQHIGRPLAFCVYVAPEQPDVFEHEAEHSCNVDELFWPIVESPKYMAFEISVIIWMDDDELVSSFKNVT